MCCIVVYVCVSGAPKAVRNEHLGPCRPCEVFISYLILCIFESGAQWRPGGGYMLTSALLLSVEETRLSARALQLAHEGGRGSVLPTEA